MKTPLFFATFLAAGIFHLTSYGTENPPVTISREKPVREDLYRMSARVAVSKIREKPRKSSKPREKKKPAKSSLWYCASASDVF